MRNSKYIIFFNSLLFLIQIQLVQSQLTSNGLVLNLDASNSTSYSGIGATWNDISGNNNHFNINTATYNSEGYFVFDGDDSMTGPPSNSFGLSQTDHTIEIILEPVSGGGSVINFRGDSHNYGINAHLPWSSNVIFYDVGGCCDSDDRIEGGPNIVGQKTHVILRSKPSGDSKREVFVNGSSVINSGSSNTSTNNFTSVEATIGGFIYSDGNSHHTNSKIYSVRVYNRALTDQEISNNYNHYLHPNNIPVVNTHVTSGLVMYVDAENDLSYNGSGLSWNDLSGNNNNGTISGASYDSDRKSFDFDGNDDKVSFPAVLSEGDDTYTIEAYFKTDQNKTQVIWEQNTSVSTSHRRGCMILLSDGEGGFNGQNNDRHDEIDYSAGLWNHWVIAIDNNGGYPQVEMYVNGVLHWQGNQANGGELNLGSHGSAIGYKLSSNGEYFNGEIKSVRIYNRKLNADEIKQNYWSTINRYLVTDGLQLYLDADNFSSFPGTGNFWYDLSQSNYDFTINSDAFRTVNDIKHMDFEGSYGAAQYIVNGSRLNVPSYSNATMQVFTSIKNTTSDHRTLVRGSANDHPVIIEIGNNNLGMHDNDNGGFIDTGFDITSLPNPYTQFNFLDFKLAQSSPYMKFRYNTDTNVYQITDPNANYHRGFHAIGKWFQNQNNVNTGSQWWGKIGVFLYYDRELTESETTQNFNAFASRFGLESEADNTAPEIFSSKLKVDNSVVSITFTEAVYNSSNGSGNLEASDFNLTISGGNATLSSSNPSSILIDGSTISLGIPLNGIPDGDEILTISPANNAIFDAAGNPASTSQTSNTIQLISDIVTSGLMIYLDASNENSYSGSGSIWYDLTSNGNDGVISGTTFSNDGGGSFEFGSSSDYVEIGDDPSLDMDNNQMTISYLIEIDRTGTNWSPVIEKGSGLNNCGTGNLNYYTWYGNNDLQIDFVGNTNLRGQLYYATADDFYTGQFRLITITIDQSNFVKTYIDGEIKHTLNHNGQVLGPVTDGPLVIGKCPDPDGKIRSLMIYNRALSSDEVYQNYNSLSKAPKIISTSISADNSTVSVTFDQLVYNSNSGSGNLETTDFSLFISGGTSTLSSSTPSSISISGDTIELGVPLAGSYNGNEQLTVNLTSYSVFNSIGYNASSQQISNTVSLNNLAPTDIGFQSSNIPTDGLVLHLDAQNSNSNTGSDDRWSDLSSSGNDILFSNPKPLFTQDSNGVKILRTTNATGSLRNMVSAPTNPNVVIGNNAYTAISFFKPNSTDSRRMLLSYGPPDNNCNGAQLHPLVINNQGKFGGGSCGGRNTWDTNSGVTPSTSQYVFQATSWDGSTERVYINGTLDKSSSSHTNNVTDSNNNKFSIGWVRDDGASYTMDADIGVILFYNRKLTDSEINDIYQNYNDRFTNGQIPSSSNGSVQEGSSVGTLVTNLVATDPDSTEFTFSLVSGDGSNDIHNSYFTVSGTQLLVNNGDIDFETTPSLNINLQVSDGANTFAKAFTVSVTNINEAPIDLGFTTSSLLENGLVLYLDSRNPNSYSGSGNTWSDLSGNSNDFIMVGNFSHSASNGFDFETGQSTKYFKDDSFAHPTTTFTDEFLIKTSRNTYSAWKSYNVSGNDNQSLMMQFSNEDNLYLGLPGGDFYSNVSGISDGAWHHLVRTSNRTSGAEKIYLDGQLVYNQTVQAGSLITTNGHYYIGQEQDSPGGGLEASQAFDGFLPIVRLYNRVLTAEEVSSNFSAMISNGNPTPVNSSGSSSSTASFDEGSAVGTVVATLTATDSDTTNLTYSLVAGNGSNDQHNSLFTVSGNQLLVASSTISYDTTTSLNVNIEVSDGQHTITKAFQIAVNDLNRAPTDIVLTSNTITENASPSTVVGTLSSVDSDTTDTTSFTLATSGDAQDDDNGSFTISGTSLILNSSPDYETKASYNIYINVNDGANNYAKAFTVSVTNINEAPTNIGITSTTINSDAFKFNGTNSYIEIPYAAVNHPAEFTIELWARLDQSTNNFQSPLSSRYGSSPWNNLSGYNFYAVNGLEKWSFTGGSGSWESINTSPTTNEEIYDGNTLKFGIWTHLASTYDGTTYRLYVNGILVGSKTAGYSRVGFNSIPARPLRIGAGRTEGSATYFFNGAVDEVRIWNYARTQSQIDYNKSFNLSGQESGLVSYYQFESGTATNKTGVNGTNGTLYNSPTTVSGIVLFPTSGSNSGTVDEESSIGTLVGYLIANDPDTADLTYSLVSGDGSNDQHNSLFSISGNQLLVAGNIDYETNSTLNIYVQVSDGENTYEKAMIVNVNDIKEVTSIQVNDIIKTFGDADFDLSATSSNTGAFTYTVTDQNIATVNGSTVTIVGAGSTSITVVQAEDDNFASSTATFTITVNKTDPTITLSDISKTYGDDDFNLSASSSSTGAFTYSVTDQNIATLNGNILTVVGAGSTSITVSQAADNNYNTASKTINLSVAKGTPVLSFNDVVKNYGDTSFTIEAQSQTSSGSLTFSSSDNSVVSISGSTATVNGAGSSIITVTQSETANYTATTTSFTITVNKIDPTLSEFSNVTKTFGDPSFEITPPIKNNDNTGVFTYSSSDPSIVSINNNNLTINGAGSAVLTANLALDNNYNSGSITTNVTVEKANQTISIGALPENQPLKDFDSIPLDSSSSSNAPIIISLDQGSAASLSGNVGNYSLVSIQQTGIVTITFTTDDSNNPNYKTVSTTLSINVVKSNQSVSYSNNPPSQITYSENLSITLGASASSGLAPEYAIVSGDNASLNNNILSINDTGQITVEASQPGDVNYNPAVPITSIINVIQAPTTLSSLSVPNKTMQDDDFYLTPVVSNRPGDIIYTSSDPQVAIVSGTLVRIIGVGDATITATQNANSKYLSAEISANFTITIGDSDGDGIVDVSDNCDFVVNPEQLDTDGDGIGDLCDPDLDGDGVTNELDNCPMDYNPDQANNDNDSRGDICDSDDDNDGYSDIQDFFPFDPNEWSDTDRDGIGNNADTDDDNDNYLDTDDAFPLNPKEWLDTDGDGIGNNEDQDDDNDGVEDKNDAFPLDESEHTDTDKDGIGNNADEDDDGDGYSDLDEIACNSDPLNRYNKPRDYDRDMIPNCIDPDDDNDGCLNEEDLFPLNERECIDTDGDGIGDNADLDADNDGVFDPLDDFPLDPNESKDTDGDGIGDNADLDDNNDGFPEDPVTNDAGEQVIPLFVSGLLTPNEMGEESIWRIVNIEKYPSANVKIYNSSWVLVYESWNYQNDWNGTNKDGNPLPSGPYFYRIDRGNETTVEEGWMYIFN